MLQQKERLKRFHFSFKLRGLKLEIACQFFDAVLIAGCFYLAASVHDFPWNVHFSLLAVVSVSMYYFIAKKHSLYMSWRTSSIWAESKEIIKSWSFAMLITIGLALLMNLIGEHFRGVMLSWFLLGLTTQLLWRAVLRLMLHQVRRKGRNRKYVAIAGAGVLGVRVASSILNNPWTGLEVRGVYDDNRAKGTILSPDVNIRVEGTLDDLIIKSKSGCFDCVYIALPLRAEKRIIDLAEKLSETRATAYIVPSQLMFDFLEAKIMKLEGIQSVNIVESPLFGKIDWIKRFPHVVKRGFDVIFSLVVIMITAPFLLLISIAILFWEGPPITYRSPRYISVNKKIYTLKFRSMVRNATDPKYKLKERFMRDGYLDIPLNCEVYTPIGRILEKTQLVEILQLFNVIFDGMSLIGNRPLPFVNLSVLKKHQGWDRRFDSPAGITGISQVVGKLNLSAQERMELECLYSDVYNKGNIVKCDILIVYYTIRLILFKRETSLESARALLINCLDRPAL